MIEVAQREKFQPTHVTLMTSTEGGLEKPFRAAIGRIVELHGVLAASVKWGELDQEKTDRIRTAICGVERSMEEVGNSKLGHRGAAAFKESTGEAAFVQSIRAVAVDLVKYAGEVLAGDHPEAPFSIAAWGRQFLAGVDRDQVMWAGRQCLSLFLCMLLGYYGYVSSAGAGVPFIYRHNPGPALIV